MAYTWHVSASTMKTMVLSIVVILINVIHKQVAVLVISPRDTEVKVNDSTYLNCSTSLAASVQWHHGKLYVYTGSDILEPYNERFSVERTSSTGAYNLVIRSVQPQDAGEYQCQDDEGFGESRSAQLTVFDDDPVCASNIRPDGVVGENSCGIEPDKIQLSCSLKYYGNIPPAVEWRKSGASHAITEGVDAYRTSNNFTSTLTVDAVSDSNLDNSSFICQTTRTLGRQCSCASEVIKVLYVYSGNHTVNVRLDETVNCVANSSLPCTYRWQWFDAEDTMTISTSQSVTPTRVGQHKCDATCILRNTSCMVTVLFAEVHSTAQEGGRYTLRALLVLLVIVVIVATIILLFWIKTRNRKQETSESTAVHLISLDPSSLSAETADDRYRKIPELIIGKQPIRTLAKGIAGITAVNNELFVLIAETNNIEVYELKEFRFIRLMEIDGLEHPVDMTSDGTNKHLHIMDSGDSLKKIITVDRSGRVLKEYSTRDKLGCLSVTEELDILLAVGDDSPRIQLYNIDAGLFQTIELPSDCTHPRHAVRLTNGKYLVSHGLGHSKHRVCMVSETGDMINQYGGEKGANVGQFNSPYHLAVDSAGYILVADVNNSRIVLLDPNLKFIRELISSAVDERFDLRNPVRMYFDEERGRLYVADSANDENENRWKGGRFWVFEVIMRNYSTPVTQMIVI